MPMAKKSVPNTSTQYRISTPTPDTDILFGYDTDLSFKNQATQMSLLGKEPVANTPGTAFPFLTVEFKGAGKWPFGRRHILGVYKPVLGGSRLLY